MWYTMTLQEVIKKIGANLDYGLNDEQVKERLSKYGKNKLEDKKRENIIIKFIKQFNDFMIIILIIASIVSAVITKTEGSNDYIDSIMIIAIVIFNAIMGLIQESKAEKALEALKKMSAPTAKVKRNGKIFTIDSQELVPGDFIILEAGGYVPADCRLINSFNLKIEESSLTGETVPVSKDSKVILNGKVAVGDILNMAFGTTIVVNGHGEAIVTDTAMNTNVGKIAKMIITNESPQTPIQRKLAGVGKTLGIASLVICLAIFIIGIIKKIPILEMFMTSVGLAVAAIPEGLPAIVTIMLSIGVTKMAKKNAIIRKLPAVETLGSSTVICSDKTGTLTQNKMQVIDTFGLDNTPKKFILQLATMCTDVNLINDNNNIITNGEPTEVAIVNAALQVGENKNDLYRKMERINEISFDSNRKLMTTIHKIGNRYRIVTKGAPDILIKKCSRMYSNGNIGILDYNKTIEIQKNNSKMADNALRVLAVAYKDLDILPSRINEIHIENDLIFVGLIGMIDPPREGVYEAVYTCRKAGIKIVMITGDHIATAKAIAKQLGILRTNDLAITGEELDKIPQKKLEKDIMRYSVFARVSPEHKVRIVKAFRANGNIVAMTGDRSK